MAQLRLAYILSVHSFLLALAESVVSNRLRRVYPTDPVGPVEPGKSLPPGRSVPSSKQMVKSPHAFRSAPHTPTPVGPIRQGHGAGGGALAPVHGVCVAGNTAHTPDAPDGSPTWLVVPG